MATRSVLQFLSGRRAQEQGQLQVHQQQQPQHQPQQLQHQPQQQQPQQQPHRQRRGRPISSNYNTSSSQPNQSRRRSMQQQPTPALSPWSDHPLPSALWVNNDILLGAGMVVIQKETHKLLVLTEEDRQDSYFLPKGRKDVGETLEGTALREAYEETGYPVTFMDAWLFHNQPGSLFGPRFGPSHEPLGVSTFFWPPKIRNQQVIRPGMQYFTTWYLGQVEQDAVYNPNTRMPDEVGFQTHFVAVEEALPKLSAQYQRIVEYGWKIYLHTLEQNARMEQDQEGSSQQANLSQVPQEASSRQEGG